jgi:hypothetical protein
LSRFGKVPQYIAAIAVANERARWNSYYKIFALPTVALVALPWPTLLRTPMLSMRDIGQVVGIGYCFDNHAAAVAAVAAVRPTTRNVLLAPEAAATSTSVATFDMHDDPIDEHSDAHFTRTSR